MNIILKKKDVLTENIPHTIFEDRFDIHCISTHLPFNIKPMMIPPSHFGSMT